MTMTIGAIATTRSSTAPVNQVVQPRFEPPVTTNRVTGGLPFSLAQAWRASMARTALLAIGKSSGQFSSLVCEIADESLGDQLVFGLAVQERLVRHLRQDGYPRSAKLGQTERLLVVVVVLLAGRSSPPVMNRSMASG